MPVKIHHGPPGSYKTSGAVNDDLIPWAQQGRVVITNVRGLHDVKHFIDNYYKQDSLLSRFLPNAKPVQHIGRDFDLIYLDTDTTEGRTRMQHWFQWAPFGSAFLIDEIQTIYPQKFTAADYKKIAYDSVELAADDNNRPEDVYIAFEKHRHYNWDFVVTAPNIKKVPPIIRDISEVAYCHSNKGKIGLKGMYLEAMHNPDDSGKSESSWISHTIKRAPKKAFTLYKSTSTGVVKDTEAGKNIFLQPKIMIMLALFIVLAVWNISKGNPLDTTKYTKESQTLTDDVKNSLSASASPDLNNSSVVSGVSGRQIGENTAVVDTEPLNGFKIYIGGQIVKPFIYAMRGDTMTQIDVSTLIKLGYSVTTFSDCFWSITYGDKVKFLTCRPDNDSSGSNPLIDTFDKFSS